MAQLSLHTPLGDLTVSERDNHIVSLDWGWARDQTNTVLLTEAHTQLQDYFDGERQTFELPLDPPGTPYQCRVWQALCRIPIGETSTYAEIARQVGGSARSVGQANRANPIPILIPCHRVVSASGTRTNILGGYSAGNGLETKRWLLNLERNHLSIQLDKAFDQRLQRREA